jgi:hypothetical protein
MALEISQTYHSRVDATDVAWLEKAFNGAARIGFKVALLGEAGNSSVYLERTDGHTGDYQLSCVSAAECLNFTVRKDGQIEMKARPGIFLPEPAGIVRALQGEGVYAMAESEVREHLQKFEEIGDFLAQHLQGCMERRQICRMVESLDQVVVNSGGPFSVYEGILAIPDHSYTIKGEDFDLVLTMRGAHGDDAVSLELLAQSPAVLDDIDSRGKLRPVDMMDFKMDLIPSELNGGVTPSVVPIRAVQVEPGRWNFSGLDSGVGYVFQITVLDEEPAAGH